MVVMNRLNSKITISLLIIFYLLLSFFSFTWVEAKFSQGETSNNIIFQEGGNSIKESFLIAKRILGEGIRKSYQWFKVNVWQGIALWFKNQFNPCLKKELEKRKTIMREELRKEEERIKDSIPQWKNFFWEKIKGVINNLK